jgi:5-methylcytosine-specific restriction endonuclease McrA
MAARARRAADPDRTKEIRRRAYLKNREAVRARAKRYYEANKDKLLPAQRERSRANREVLAIKERAWRQANKDRILERNRRWRAANPEKDRQHARDKYQRYKQNPSWRLTRVMRAGMWKSLKGVKGSGRWFDLLDYTVDELRAHIERQFLKGMSWGNFGEWHVDHIVPLSSFSFTGPHDPEFKRAWALSNLRPLWAAENMSKGGKVVSLL